MVVKPVDETKIDEQFQKRSNLNDSYGITKGKKKSCTLRKDSHQHLLMDYEKYGRLQL